MKVIDKNTETIIGNDMARFIRRLTRKISWSIGDGVYSYEDLAQEALITLFSNQDKTPSLQKTIMKRRMIDLLRARKSQKKTPDMASLFFHYNVDVPEGYEINVASHELNLKMYENDFSEE